MIELEHVVPQDGFEHVCDNTLSCPCGPFVHCSTELLIPVVVHRRVEAGRAHVLQRYLIAEDLDWLETVRCPDYPPAEWNRLYGAGDDGA